MKAILTVVTLLAVGACAGASSSNSSSTSSQQSGAEACTYPANADTSDDAGAGCTAATPGKICQVSNGASILADGGVSGGTETCTSSCGASDYELTCKSASLVGAIPSPDSSLGCTIIPIPTPSDALFYCCPCAK